MTGPSTIQPKPAIVALGDSSVLVRFDGKLSETANQAAIAFAGMLDQSLPEGVQEIVPNLVSVLLRYDPAVTSYGALAGELRLILFGLDPMKSAGRNWSITVDFSGPDLGEVAGALGLSVSQFIATHNARALRVLATGFAPGFVYCGLHDPALLLPRRPSIRPSVPASSILFAAGQTAITSTEMPTGWHLIGQTNFKNFDRTSMPPTHLRAGDLVRFEPSA
jgi:KipI family sensor histidine kinase inhibitor